MKVFDCISKVLIPVHFSIILSYDMLSGLCEASRVLQALLHLAVPLGRD